MDSIEKINLDTSLKFELVTLINGASERIARSIKGERNQTFSQDSFKDRISNTDLEKQKLIVQANDAERTLQSSPNQSTIRTGTFRINNVAISVNPDQDSIFEVIHKINSSQAGVHARFDQINNEFIIDSLKGKKFTLNGDTSNFLNEVNLKEGLYLGSTERPSLNTPGNYQRQSEVLSSIRNLTESFNRASNNKALNSAEQRDLLSAAKTIIEQKLLNKKSFPGIQADFNKNQLRLDLRINQNITKNSPEKIMNLSGGKNGFSALISDRIYSTFEEKYPEGDQLDVEA